MTFHGRPRSAYAGLILALFGVLLFALPSPAAAQTERDAVFAQMLERPADTALMLRYAQLSIDARDYEAAAATLERLLDLDPQAQDARLALAKAYFALGANAVAEYHLTLYRERGQLTEAEAAEADAFVQEARIRQQPLTFEGFLSAGAVRRSDLGETGLSYSAALGLDWDMGGAIANSWRTIFRLDGYRFSDAPGADTTQFLFRTGPVLSLDGQAFGPRIQTYFEARLVEDDDPADDADTLVLGALYTNPITDKWSVFADLGFGRIRRDAPATDADLARFQIGATLRPTERTRIRFSTRWQDEQARGGGTDRERIGARLDASLKFSPAWSRVDRNWEISGFLQIDRDEFGTGREDDLTSYGVALKGYLTEAAFWRLSARRVERDSTTAAFDSRETFIGLQAGWEF